MSYRVDWIPVEEKEIFGHKWFTDMGKKHTDRIWINTKEKGVSITDCGAVMYIGMYEEVTHFAHYINPEPPSD